MQRDGNEMRSRAHLVECKSNLRMRSNHDKSLERTPHSLTTREARTSMRHGALRLPPPEGPRRRTRRPRANAPPATAPRPPAMAPPTAPPAMTPPSSRVACSAGSVGSSPRSKSSSHAPRHAPRGSSCGMAGRRNADGSFGSGGKSGSVNASVSSHAHPSIDPPPPP